MKHQAPTYDLETERALLAILLTVPELPGVRAEVAAIVEPSDFSPQGRALYEAIQAQNGAAVDALTTVAYLEERGGLERAGGEGFIQKLASTVPAFHLAGPYARRLAGLGEKRRRHEKAEAAARAILEGRKRDALLLLDSLDADEQPAAGWPWRTLANAYEPRPARRWLVSGLLPIPSVTTAFGLPGGLKTMLLQDLAACVAGGRPWLAPLPDAGKVAPFQVEQAPVLWVDVDNGLDRCERRFAALGRAHELPEDAPLAYISFPTPPFVAQDTAAVDLVLEAIGRTGAGLVVIDNLGAVSGGADENSAQMIAVMSGLRRIAEAGGCAVVVIHHAGKGQRDRAGERLRGQSSIEAAIELALLVERDRDGDTLTLRSTKTRDVPVKPFSALWTYEADADGELTRGRFFGLGEPEGQALSKQQQAELCIVKDMVDGTNQTGIVELVKANAGIGKGTALAALRRLVDSGQLCERAGEKDNARLYYRK